MTSGLQDIKQATATLGVTHSVLRRWFALGAPHQRVANPNGGIKKYVCDPREVFAWVKMKQIAGELEMRHLQKRVPAEQAQQTLVEVKDYLGLSLTDVAKLAEVPRKIVHRILYYDTYGMKTFAYDAVTRISLLPCWVEPRRKRGQKPTKQQVRHALEHCGGIRNRAYKYLGVEYHVLHSLIEEYDLDTLVNYKYAKRGA